MIKSTNDLVENVNLAPFLYLNLKDFLNFNFEFPASASLLKTWTSLYSTRMASPF